MTTNILMLSELESVPKQGGRKPNPHWDAVKSLAPGQAIASWSKSDKSMQLQVYAMKKNKVIPDDVRTGIRRIDGVPTLVIYRPEATATTEETAETA